MSGMYFMQAQRPEIEAFTRELAQKRGKKWPRDQDLTVHSGHLHLLLPPGGVQRKAEYDSIVGPPDRITTSCMVDLDHHPNNGPSGHRNGYFPTLLTHNSVYSYNHRRLATSFECLAAMGLDMYPEIAGNRGISPLRNLFASFSDREVAKRILPRAPRRELTKGTLLILQWLPIES